MRTGDSNKTVKKKAPLFVIMVLRGSVFVTNTVGASNFTHRQIVPQKNLNTFFLLHATDTPPFSPVSPPVSSLTHSRGCLAQERGIINFLEWQMLDMWKAVLSHPLLGVPQPHHSFLPSSILPFVSQATSADFITLTLLALRHIICLCFGLKFVHICLAIYPLSHCGFDSL